MENWEFSIINRIPSGLILGWSFYVPEGGEFNYYEFDLYLLFVQFQLRWE